VKLTLSKYRFDSHGNLQAAVTLLADDETPLFEDFINLSKQSSRYRFAQSISKRFPELKGKDIESQLLQLLWKAQDEHDEVEMGETKGQASGRVSQADKLVKLVEENRVELFHTQTGTAYARMTIEGHFEIHRCRSHGFRQWLSRQLYLTEGKTPNSDALNSAIICLEGKAIFDGETHELHNRVAFHEGAAFYDLADENWRSVRVTPEGWEIVDAPPILFCRYQHQKAQCQPVRGGDIRRILDFVNLRDDSQKLLFLVYAMCCFIPEIPHPIIHLFGPKGATKTTLFRLLVSLVDPSAEELLIFPKDIAELAQKLSHHWLCFLDNLSSLPEWTSDTLSRAVTGAGFSKRELYTDEGDIIFQIKRVVGLNGINVVATKPDLLDRCILLELGRISDDERKEEQQLLVEFAEAKPQILGGIFNCLATAMGTYPTLELKTLPRMADFAHWGAAIAVALGYSATDFLDAYNSNIRTQNIEVLTSNPVSSTLLALMESRDAYEGSPSDLLEELTQMAELLKVKTTTKSWPGAPHILTRRLKELKSNLQDEGIDIDMGGGTKLDGKWKRQVKIWKNERTARPKSSENSAASVVALPSNVEPYLRNGNAIGNATDIVNAAALPERQKGNATDDGGNATDETALLSEQPHSQIQSQRHNGSNAKLHTSGADAKSDFLQFVDTPCRVCGSTTWWQRTDGGWVCGRCHPKPS
jgi:hypothetical protein